MTCGGVRCGGCIDVIVSYVIDVRGRNIRYHYIMTMPVHTNMHENNIYSQNVIPKQEL